VAFAGDEEEAYGLECPHFRNRVNAEVQGAAGAMVLRSFGPNHTSKHVTAHG
jgi:hypothetical protein